ncbi:hypothetical protein LZ554_008374 [Drepanopeziza brunnea f. sp. 'monogermtubi']|nr:hypothetical protein LZ554_008374 [Drepanopeziza brunnea f. sp. 'monogermtubi']
MLLQNFVALALLGLSSLVAAGYFPKCSHNNCYRAFNGDAYAEEAKSFCSVFTTGITLSVDDAPTHAIKKCTRVAQLSSVCRCAYGTPTPAPELLTTSLKLSSTTSESSSAPTSTAYESTSVSASEQVTTSSSASSKQATTSSSSTLQQIVSSTSQQNSTISTTSPTSRQPTLSSSSSKGDVSLTTSSAPPEISSDPSVLPSVPLSSITASLSIPTDTLSEILGVPSSSSGLSLSSGVSSVVGESSISPTEFPSALSGIPLTPLASSIFETFLTSQTGTADATFATSLPNDESSSLASSSLVSLPTVSPFASEDVFSTVRSTFMPVDATSSLSGIESSLQATPSSSTLTLGDNFSGFFSQETYVSSSVPTLAIEPSDVPFASATPSVTGDLDSVSSLTEASLIASSSTVPELTSSYGVPEISSTATQSSITSYIVLETISVPSSEAQVFSSSVTELIPSFTGTAFSSFTTTPEISSSFVESSSVPTATESSNLEIPSLSDSILATSSLIGTLSAATSSFSSPVSPPESTTIPISTIEVLTMFSSVQTSVAVSSYDSPVSSEAISTTIPVPESSQLALSASSVISASLSESLPSETPFSLLSSFVEDFSTIGLQTSGEPTLASLTQDTSSQASSQGQTTTPATTIPASSSSTELSIPLPVLESSSVYITATEIMTSSIQVSVSDLFPEASSTVAVDVPSAIVTLPISSTIFGNSLTSTAVPESYQSAFSASTAETSLSPSENLPSSTPSPPEIFSSLSSSFAVSSPTTEVQPSTVVDAVSLTTEFIAIPSSVATDISTVAPQVSYSSIVPLSTIASLEPSIVTPTQSPSINSDAQSTSVTLSSPGELSPSTVASFPPSSSGLPSATASSTSVSDAQSALATLSLTVGAPLKSTLVSPSTLIPDVFSSLSPTSTAGSLQPSSSGPSSGPEPSPTIVEIQPSFITASSPVVTPSASILASSEVVSTFWSVLTGYPSLNPDDVQSTLVTATRTAPTSGFVPDLQFSSFGIPSDVLSDTTAPSTVAPTNIATGSSTFAIATPLSTGDLDVSTPIISQSIGGDVVVSLIASAAPSFAPVFSIETPSLSSPTSETSPVDPQPTTFLTLVSISTFQTIEAPESVASLESLPSAAVTAD